MNDVQEHHRYDQSLIMTACPSLCPYIVYILQPPHPQLTTLCPTLVPPPPHTHTRAEYAALVAACLHPIPKVRPRMADVYATLYFLLRHSLAAASAGQQPASAPAGPTSGSTTPGPTVPGRGTNQTPPSELWRSHTTSALLAILPAGSDGHSGPLGARDGSGNRGGAGGGRDTSPLGRLLAGASHLLHNRDNSPGAAGTHSGQLPGVGRWIATRPSDPTGNHGQVAGGQRVPADAPPMQRGASLPAWLGPGGLLRVGTANVSRMGIEEEEAGGESVSGAGRAGYGGLQPQASLGAPSRMGTISLFDSLSIDMHSSTQTANAFGAGGSVHMPGGGGGLWGAGGGGGDMRDGGPQAEGL